MTEVSGSYFELQLKINPAMEDVISQLCFDSLDCEGIVLAEEAYKDLEMISTTEGTLRIFLRSDVTDDGRSIESFIAQMKASFVECGLTSEDIGSFEYTLEEKENQDWSAKWKEKWDVTRVSERIIVVPDWIEYQPKNDEIIIKLEPGCAFGTGTHQTTQLCMKAIEKYLNPQDSMADIGMGSGILAICAKKFGASYVYGCDNDETVIDVAKENAIKNDVPDIEFELNTADKVSQKFDFICANILHNVLAEIMGDLKTLLKDDAHMILSGILDEKKPVVMDAIARENLTLVEEVHQDQWVGLIVKK